MNSPSDPALDALFAAARSAPDPDARASRLEYGFETRVMARLREEQSVSIFTWAWRLCPFFAAVAIAAGLWSRTTTARVEADTSLLAAATREAEELILVHFMTGDVE